MRRTKDLYEALLASFLVGKEDPAYTQGARQALHRTLTHGVETELGGADDDRLAFAVASKARRLVLDLQPCVARGVQMVYAALCRVWSDKRNGHAVDSKETADDLGMDEQVSSLAVRLIVSSIEDPWRLCL